MNGCRGWGGPHRGAGAPVTTGRRDDPHAPQQRRRRAGRTDARQLRLELRSEVVAVFSDGSLTAAAPDLITLLDVERGCHRSARQPLAGRPRRRPGHPRPPRSGTPRRRSPWSALLRTASPSTTPAAGEHPVSRTTAPLALAELVRVDPLARGRGGGGAARPRPAGAAGGAGRDVRPAGAHPAHSLVVLHAEAATGGWSLGRRCTWRGSAERAGVVVPRPAMSGASALLARRLGTGCWWWSTTTPSTSPSSSPRAPRPRSRRGRSGGPVRRGAGGAVDGARGVLGVLNAELAPGVVALVAGSSVLAGRAAAVLQREGYGRCGWR